MFYLDCDNTAKRNFVGPCYKVLFSIRQQALFSNLWNIGDQLIKSKTYLILYKFLKSGYLKQANRFNTGVCNKRPAAHSPARQAIWCGPCQHSDFFSSFLKS